MMLYVVGSIPLPELGPFRGKSPMGLTLLPPTLSVARWVQSKETREEDKVMLSYDMGALAPLSSPVHPPLLF